MKYNFSIFSRRRIAAKKILERKDFTRNINEIVSTKIPKGVEEISENLFHGCTKLKKVKLPSTLKKIGDMAFKECELLENIEIPEGVEKISVDAFCGCTKLKEVKLPSTLKVIETDAFMWCESLENIEIPEGVEIIDSYAFYGCGKLKEVKLPSTLKKIGYEAFKGCESLENIEIPYGLKKVLLSSFNDCKNLKTIKLPLSVTEINMEEPHNFKFIYIIDGQFVASQTKIENLVNVYDIIEKNKEISLMHIMKQKDRLPEFIEEIKAKEEFLSACSKAEKILARDYCLSDVFESYSENLRNDIQCCVEFARLIELRKNHFSNTRFGDFLKGKFNLQDTMEETLYTLFDNQMIQSKEFAKIFKSMQYVGESVKKDINSCIYLAINGCGDVLKYADESLLKNENFVLKVLKNNADNVHYVKEPELLAKGIVLNENILKVLRNVELLMHIKETMLEKGIGNDKDVSMVDKRIKELNRAQQSTKDSKQKSSSRTASVPTNPRRPTHPTEYVNPDDSLSYGPASPRSRRKN